MGCHPRSTGAGGIDHRSLSVVGIIFAKNTLTVWPPSVAKHLANFCPKFLTPWTIACSNHTVITGYNTLYQVFTNRIMQLALDIILVETSLWWGKTCNVWALWSSILKCLGYIFLPYWLANIYLYHRPQPMTTNTRSSRWWCAIDHRHLPCILDKTAAVLVSCCTIRSTRGTAYSS